jgi:hypothetical protein
MEVHGTVGDMIVFSPPFQQSAFQVKYQGPPLETQGIEDYQTYVQSPDAVFNVKIPIHQLRAWADNRAYFWLLEDQRWPTDWERVSWEFKAVPEAHFPGLTIYRFTRSSPDES